MFKYFVIILMTSNYCSGLFFGGGGGGGCGCGGGCPAPPVCAPQSCPQPACPPTGGGGFYSGGQVIAPPVGGGGYYAVAPQPSNIPLPIQPPIGGGTYITNAGAIPSGAYPGISGSSAAYLTSQSAAQAPIKTTVVKTRYSSSGEKDKDFYDEPPPDLKVADVSAESKELHATDIFRRRYLMLKNLRHRHLRQLSAPSLPLPSSNVCNSEKLARIMAKSIVTDISISKRLVRKATELAFDGLKFDVICAQGDFSYSIYAEQYCELTRATVTCFAFA